MIGNTITSHKLNTLHFYFGGPQDGSDVEPYLSQLGIFDTDM